MMDLLLQDLTTVRVASGSQVVQSPSRWLDLGNLEDVSIFTDVRETSTGTPPTITIETSPTAQDPSFVTFVSFSVAVGLRTDVVPAYLAKVPAARFLRWKLTPPVGAGADATFRIWLAAYGWT